MLRFQPKTTTRWGYDTTALYVRQRFPSRRAAVVHANMLRRQGWSIDSAYPNRYAGEVWEIVGVRRATIAERAAWYVANNKELRETLEVSVAIDGKPINAKNVFAEAMSWVRWTDNAKNVFAEAMRCVRQQ